MTMKNAYVESNEDNKKKTMPYVADSWFLGELAGMTWNSWLTKHEKTEPADREGDIVGFESYCYSLPSCSHCSSLASFPRKEAEAHDHLLRVFSSLEIYFGFVVVIPNITDVLAFFHIIPQRASCYP